LDQNAIGPDPDFTERLPPIPAQPAVATLARDRNSLRLNVFIAYPLTAPDVRPLII
jgi:hypothetical protein